MCKRFQLVCNVGYLTTVLVVVYVLPVCGWGYHLISSICSSLEVMSIYSLYSLSSLKYAQFSGIFVFKSLSYMHAVMPSESRKLLPDLSFLYISFLLQLVYNRYYEYVGVTFHFSIILSYFPFAIVVFATVNHTCLCYHFHDHFFKSKAKTAIFLL